MFKNSPKVSRWTLNVLVAITPLCSHSAFADLEQVTFQSGGFLLGTANPGGPAPVAVSGDFFFNTSTVMGGLLPVFDWPGSPPGNPGTANVSFAQGPAGEMTITYANGATLAQPFASGFTLHRLFDPCGPFGDCVWEVGRVLTVSQFQAAPDPWALVLNGMSGSTDEFLLGWSIPAESPGTGQWVIADADARFQIHPVPEPSTVALAALGALSLTLVAWGRKRRNSE